MYQRGFVYLEVEDLSSLVGDLVTNRIFSATSSPITLARAERAIIRAAVHTATSIQPLRLPRKDLIDLDVDENVLLYDTIKEAQTYQAGVMAMDTIASTADASAGGEQGATQAAKRSSRRAEYQRTYRQFVLGLKTQLHGWKPITPDTPARFKVGEGFGAVPRDYRYYEPISLIGDGGGYADTPGRGPAFFGRN